MSVDLVITLWTDADGNDRFSVQYPLETDNLLDVTDQFELAVVKTEDGRTGFMVVKKPQVVSCLDGPVDL